jgi:hypothetical protein
MNIKQFYLENYPMDDLGLEINPNANFIGLLKEIFTDGDVYKYVGVVDSVVRERLFEKLAELTGLTYDTIYDLWLNDEVIEEPKPIHLQIIDLCGGKEKFKEIAGLKS